MFKPRKTPHGGMRSPQPKSLGGATRPFTAYVTQFDLKRPHLALLYNTSRGRRVFQGVASPRPCLEFSLSRLGLELSASASALMPRLRTLLPCLASPLRRPLCLDLCLCLDKTASSPSLSKIHFRYHKFLNE